MPLCQVPYWRSVFMKRAGKMETMKKERKPQGYRSLAVGKVRYKSAMSVLGAVDTTGKPAQLFT